MAGGPRVVIIGAGIVGAGIADELTMRGWTNVTVVDQGPLWAAGGSTSHAPGIIFQANGSRTMATMARQTVEKLMGIDLDGQWCFRQVGSLEVARTEERLRDLSRRHGWLTSWGIESRLIDPEEAVRLSPLMDPGTILGALHDPTDGFTKPVRAVERMARRSMERGARFLGEHPVTAIRTQDGHVSAVVTEKGEIPADLVICAAGLWGPLVGAMVGQPIPLLPLAHQYIRTVPLPALAAIAASPELEGLRPVVRDQDRDLYFREHADRFGVGSYAHDPLPVDPATLERPAPGRQPAILPFTPEHMAGPLADAAELFPALRGAPVEWGIDGIFSFTPDGFPVVGESRQVAGFWVAEAVWITHSQGVAQAVAELLVDGHATLDLHELDLHRFEPHQLEPGYVDARGRQGYIEVYDVIHPLQPMEDPRPLRTSPFHPREEALGARFLEGGGWERPHWYEANAPLLDRYPVGGRGEWASRFWSPIAGAEALATRDRVALYDLTPLTRIEVSGPGSAAYLQRMTTNDVDRPVGTVIYTLMLNEAGGILSDLTVARLGRDHFQVGANGALDVDRLRHHAPRDGSVTVREITAGTSCVGIWGPRARDVVARLTGEDLTNASFRYFRAKRLTLDHIPVTALRVSYVGELGWELYTSADHGLALWDRLMRAGAEDGIIAAGRSAFASLRLEKGYRLWGVDMSAEDDPWEAGLGWVVKPGKGDFVGRAALEGRGDATARRRLLPLVMDEPAHVVLGKEPVFLGGRAAGYVTSAAMGYTIGRPIAYAWLPPTTEIGTRVEVEHRGERYPATVSAEPLVDPKGERLRV